MIEFPKNPHTAIITGSTGCGKTFFVMNLLTNEYLNYFDVVIVLCPTFLDNDTYIKHINLFNKLEEIKRTTFIYSNNFEQNSLEKQIDIYSIKYKRKEILFLLDDMISDSSIVKKRTSFTYLASCGRHTNRSLWILTQKYNCVGKDVRAQAAWICSFHCKDIHSFRDMIDENDTDDFDFVETRKFLKGGKRRKLFLKTDFPIYSMLCE